ncbi:MAG: hypothetical protein KDA89_05260 [Planctomycetaceae bacterium]|nr:hypothetical protein [Planctomycetaceae bacterium]
MAVIVFLVGSGIGTILFLVRQFRISRIAAEDRLHKITHLIRDEAHYITAAQDDSIRRNRLECFYQNISENIADYFRKRENNPSVDCVLRIASQIDGEWVYSTVGRSSGLAEERRTRTQSELATEGIAKRFFDHDRQGAYIIRDRMEAARADIWKLTNNDALPDVKVILSLPINGWHRKELQMLGLMHLTCRNGNFRKTDWVPAKAIADLIGHVLTLFYTFDVPDSGE